MGRLRLPGLIFSFGILAGGIMNHTIVQAKRGDPSATATLVEALRPRISRMAAHYARVCREDQDDLLQEAWAGLLEALPGVDPHIGSPEQYLIRYARWRLLDAVRRARCRRFDSLDEEIPDPGAFSALENAAAAVFSADFVHRLKPTPRAVLACLLAGLTWREAGDTLGCSSANIAYHVRRIKEQYEEWTTRP